MHVVPRLTWPSWRWITLTRHAFARELDGVGVAQLVRREAAPDTRLAGEPAKLDARVGARPRPPARRAVDDAEQRPDRQLDPGGQPRSKLLPPPRVHADLAPPAALAVAHEQRPAPGVEVALAEHERFLNAQSAAPEHDDKCAEPEAVPVAAALAHDRDDLLHGRRVSGVAQSFVARRAPGVVTGQRRR